MKTVYLVMTVKERLNVEVLGLKRPLELQWSDGMIGAVPVFEDYESALKYADGLTSLVVEAKIPKETK